jgi:hypothetical protein
LIVVSNLDCADRERKIVDEIKVLRLPVQCSCRTTHCAVAHARKLFGSVVYRCHVHEDGLLNANNLREQSITELISVVFKREGGSLTSEWFNGY